MNFKFSGITSSKSTRDKLLKLIVAILLSNVFFFLLFFKNETPSKDPHHLPDGWVEVQLRAELLTPFQNGKKVLLVNRGVRQKLTGMLKEAQDPEGKITIMVKEAEADRLFMHEHWEVLPFLNNLSFPGPQKGVSHEIRY